MKKRILSILIAVSLVIALIVPFATPAMAVNEPVLTSLSPNISPVALPQVYTVTFSGSNLTNTTTVNFADPNITVDTYNYAGLPASFTASVHVAAGTTHGPKEVRATNVNGTGPWLYNGYSVAIFPSPSNATSGAVGLTIQACRDTAGLNIITTPVHENDIVYYKLTLRVNNLSDFNFYGGELSVRFPDGLTYHPTAGFGAITPLAPQIPEVVSGVPFSAVCQTPYTVHATDLDAFGRLLAETDYGPHADSPTQAPGIQEGFSKTIASASVQISLIMFGMLQVTKSLDLNGVPGAGLTQDFFITVSGPGGPYLHTFHVVDGSVQSPNPWVLIDLNPGFYIVSETNPAPNWTATGGGLINILTGQTVSSNITNELVMGQIKVLKNDQFGQPLAGSTFTITQTAGGSYTATVADQSGSDGDPGVGIILFQNVPPGTYTVSETGVPPGYIKGADQTGVIVNPSAVVTVTFANTQGEIIILKKDAAGNLINLTGATFTVNPNPYGSGILTVVDNDANDTNKTNGTIDLINVPLGSYTVTETVAPAGYKIDPTPQTAVVSSTTPIITLSFVNTRGEIIILKKDAAGNLINLTGATFTVNPNPYGSGILTVVDNDANDTNKTNGTIDLINVPLGSYVVTETVAPAGYKIDPTPQTAVVSSTTPVITLSFVNTRGEIIILKKDAAGNLINLTGATFTVNPNPYGSGILTVVDNDANDTNKTNGTIDLINVPLGSYTVTETVAPAGYKIDPTPQTAVVSSTTPIITLSFVNTRGEIIIMKKDAAGNLINLTGATFTVNPNPYGSGILTVVDNDANDTNKTNGTIDLINVPLGSYVVTETVAPAGYKIDPTPQTAVVSSTTPIITLSFVNTRGEIIILKKDAAGNLINLPGATFTVNPNPYATTPAILTVVDNDANDTNKTNGTIDLINVPLGSYVVTETVAPAGYKIDPTPQTAVVSSTTPIITLSFVNTRGEIIILKKDAAGNLINLPGATFTVNPNPYATTPAILTVVDNDANDTNKTNGTIDLINVPLGSYVVTETVAPAGYKIDPTPQTAVVSSTTPIITLSFVNTRGEIIILKKDAAGNLINLTGTTFTVNPNPYATTPAILTVVDNDANDTNKTNGTIDLINVPLGSYVVTETVAPAGYKIDPTPQTAVVSSTTPVITLSFVNTRGEIIILKKDAAGNLINLTGATFTVNPNPYGSGILTVVDNDANDTNKTNGTIDLINVPLGSYVVTETVAPAGYKIDPTPQTAVVSSTTPVITLSFVNTRGEIIILKKDAAGNLINLTGATFTVNPNPYGSGILTVVDNDANDTNKTNGTIDLKNVPLGSYVVTETVAPAGYKIDPTPQTAVVSSTTPVITLSFVNTRGEIIILKKDAAGNLINLTGATFTVNPNPYGSGILTVVDNDANDTNKTNGTIDLINVPLGSYVVTETVAPAGYKIDPTPQTAVVSSTTPVITLSFVNTRGEIIILKKDAAGNLINLTGATFTVNPNPYGSGILTVVDNDANDTNKTNGTIDLINVPLGSYVVTETVAPAGYKIDPTPQTAVVSSTTPIITLSFVNTRGEIIILKKDAAGNLINLTGATFTVNPNPYGSGILTVVDNDANDTNKTNGTIDLINVPLGSYVVTETVAPAGYKIDPTPQTAVVSSTTPVITLSFVNTRGEIIILKKDAAGNLINLTGATFTVNPNPYGSGILTVVDNDANDTNKTNGTIDLINVPLGSYTVTETVAPAGYQLDPTPQTAVVSSTTPIITLSFVNPPILGQIKILKNSLLGQPLAGSTFTITQTAGGSYTATITDNTSPDADPAVGVILFQNVPLGTYTVTETGVPSGYIGAPPQTGILVNSSAVVTLTFINPPILGQIKVLKNNQLGQPLAGSTFKIQQTAGGGYTQTVTDNGTGDFDNTPGIILFQNVPLGTYTVTETGVPPGYVGAPPQTGILVSSSAVVTITFVNQPNLGELIIKKKDSCDNIINLPGVTFTINPNPYGSGILTVVDNDSNDTNKTNGIIDLKNVPLGSYIVTETVAPTGYQLDSTPKTVNVNSATAPVYLYVTNDKTQLGELIIKKKDNCGDIINLPGVTFTINPNPYGSGILTVVDNDSNDTNKTNGIIDLKNMPLGSYIVTETVAPTGYQLDSTPKTVNVNSATAPVYLYVTNDKTQLGELIIKKKDNCGDIINLPGVTFTINPNPYGSGILTVVDNDSNDTNKTNGIIDLKNMPLGSYIVTETVAPAGYQLDSTPKTVNVNSTTTLVYLYVTNDQTQPKLGEIVIKKKDSCDNIINLPGVTFTINPNPYGSGILTVVDNDSNDTNKTNGIIDLKNVPLGSYIVTETVAPAGYQLDSTPKTVNVTSTTTLVYLYVTNDQTQPKLGEIVIKKKDGCDNIINLPGVTFTINPNPYGSGILTVVDNDSNDTNKTNGIIDLKNVPLGSYIVTETVAPAGYQLDSTPKTVNVTSTTTLVYLYVTNDQTQPKLGEIVIKKKDSCDNIINLPGVTFTINPNPYGSGILTVVDNDSNDTNKTNGIIDLKNVPLGSYIVTETVAPAGYQLDSTPKTVNVTSTTTLVYLYVTNDQTQPKLGEIIIKKKDSCDNIINLPGVTFTINPNPYGSGILTVVDNDSNDTNKTNGIIDLKNVPLGSYIVTETVAPAGYQLDSTPKTVNVTSTTTLVYLYVTNDQQTPKGSLKIIKFNDLDGDGCRESGEPLLSGWQFTITGPNGYSSSGTTDSNGLITLNNLASGSYKVTEILQSGWRTTTDNPQYGWVSSGDTKTLTFGNKLTTNNNLGILKIIKFNDLDGDGCKESGEPYLSGWQFTITGPNGYSGSGTTDSNGLITLNNLASGSYKVTEILQSGWKATTDNPQYGWVSSGDTKTLTFGNKLVTKGNLKIIKFNDLNGDGNRDWNEPYLSGWQFTITGPNGYSGSGTTDSNGLIALNNLPIGKYTVTEVIQSGWKVTTDNPQYGYVVDAQTKTLIFGNIKCEVVTGDGTIGFWKNNGQGLLTLADAKYLNGLSPYRNLFNTTNLTTFKSQIKTNLSNWPSGSTSDKLRAQLLATILNVREGYLKGVSSVWLNGHVKTIASIINEAISAWNSSNQSNQDYYKNLLEQINSNQIPFID